MASPYSVMSGRRGIIAFSPEPRKKLNCELKFHFLMNLNQIRNAPGKTHILDSPVYDLQTLIAISSGVALTILVHSKIMRARHSFRHGCILKKIRNMHSKLKEAKFRIRNHLLIDHLSENFKPKTAFNFAKKIRITIIFIFFRAKFASISNSSFA